jgi:hypothetical protein
MSVAGVSALSSAATVSLPSVLTLLSGNRQVKQLPLPTSEEIVSSPSCRFTMCLTIASPSPVPPVSDERLTSTR